MKFDWAAWSTGRRLMFIAVCLAAIAFLLPWSKPHPRALLTFNGFSEGWPLAGLVALLVGLLPVLRGRTFNPMVAYATAAIAVGVGVGFAFTATYALSVGTVNVAQWGSYVYITAAVAFGIGIWMDTSAEA